LKAIYLVCIECEAAYSLTVIIYLFVFIKVSWGNAGATLNAALVDGASSKTLNFAVNSLIQLGLPGMNAN
jgi:hypothetical protein